MTRRATRFNHKTDNVRTFTSHHRNVHVHLEALLKIGTVDFYKPKPNQNGTRILKRSLLTKGFHVKETGTNSRLSTLFSDLIWSWRSEIQIGRSCNMLHFVPLSTLTQFFQGLTALSTGYITFQCILMDTVACFVYWFNLFHLSGCLTVYQHALTRMGGEGHTMSSDKARGSRSRCFWFGVHSRHIACPIYKSQQRNKRDNLIMITTVLSFWWSDH